MSDYTDAYKGLLIKQYWEKANAAAEIVIQSASWERIYTFLSSFQTEFDVDSASNDRLDIIGRIVGVSRRVPEVLDKVFFGFGGQFNITGFDNKFRDIFELGALRNKFGKRYSDLQLDDPDYRFFIKAKIAKNFFLSVMTYDGVFDIQSAVMRLLRYRGYAEDRKNMTMKIHISPVLRLETLRILIRLNLFPKPQGVRLILQQTDPLNSFGFSRNPNSKGFKNLDDPVTEPGGYFARLVI